MKKRTYYKNYDTCIQGHLKLLLKSPKIHQKNKELFQEYLADCIDGSFGRTPILKPTQYNKIKRWKRVFETPALNTDATTLLDDKDTIKKALRQLERLCQRGVTANTPLKLDDYKIELKYFFKWVNQKVTGEEEDIYPKCVRWIKSPKRYSDLTQDDILLEEELDKMVDAIDNIRNKAILYSLFESTARLNEFLQLKIKDLIFDRHGIIIQITSGKTSKNIKKIRPARLFKAVHYLNLYLQTHPNKDDKNSYLWVCTDKHGKNKDQYGERLSDQSIRNIIRQSAKQAGLVTTELRECNSKGKIRRYEVITGGKRITPQFFRRGKLSKSILKLPEQIVKKMGGHSPDSKAIRRYYGIFNQDVDNAVLESYGINVSEEEKKPSEKTCTRCRTVNNPSHRFCCKCSYALTEEAFEQKQKGEDIVKQILQAIIEGKVDANKAEKIYHQLVNA